MITKMNIFNYKWNRDVIINIKGVSCHTKFDLNI